MENQDDQPNPSERTVRDELLSDCNPPPIDEALLEIIEDGSYELTDLRFFELLRETSAWLTTKPFQRKIAEWQYIIDHDAFDEETQETARKNILGISRALLPGDKIPGTDKRMAGRPLEFPPDVIRKKYDQYVAFFSTFLQLPEFAGKSHAFKMKVFKGRYPEYGACLRRTNDQRQPRTPEELATRLLVAKEMVSERTVRAALKKSKRK